MSQENQGQIISCKAANASVTAYRVVTVIAGNTIDVFDTTTSKILGVSIQNAAAAGSAVGVTINGTARVTCNSTINAGAVVAPVAGTGKIAAETALFNTTTTVIPRTLGIALESGTTNAVIEVAIIPNNIRVQF